MNVPAKFISYFVSSQYGSRERRKTGCSRQYNVEKSYNYVNHSNNNGLIHNNYTIRRLPTALLTLNKEAHGR